MRLSCVFRSVSCRAYQVDFPTSPKWLKVSLKCARTPDDLARVVFPTTTAGKCQYACLGGALAAPIVKHILGVATDRGNCLDFRHDLPLTFLVTDPGGHKTLVTSKYYGADKRQESLQFLAQ